MPSATHRSCPQTSIRPCSKRSELSNQKIKKIGGMSRDWGTLNTSWTWRNKIWVVLLNWQRLCIAMKCKPIHLFRRATKDSLLEVRFHPRFKKIGNPVHSMIGLTITPAQLWSTPQLKVTSAQTDTVLELLTERWRWLTLSPESSLPTTTFQVHAIRTQLPTFFIHSIRRVLRICPWLILIESILTRSTQWKTTASQCTSSVSLRLLPERQRLLGRARSETAVAEYTIIGVTDSKTINSNNGTSNG